MVGAVIIIVWLLVLPVLVLMSGAIASVLLGTLLNRDVDESRAGSELIDLNR